MKAKVQAMFDKSDVEKVHDLDNNTVDKNGEVAAQKNADAIRSALKDQIATGRVGSLTVDPQYLDFEALECKSPVGLQLKQWDEFVINFQTRAPRSPVPRRRCSHSSTCPRHVCTLFWA